MLGPEADPGLTRTKLILSNGTEVQGFGLDKIKTLKQLDQAFATVCSDAWGTFITCFIASGAFATTSIPMPGGAFITCFMAQGPCYHVCSDALGDIYYLLCYLRGLRYQLG